MQAYCVKCRTKREMKGTKAINHEEWETHDKEGVPGMRD